MSAEVVPIAPYVAPVEKTIHVACSVERAFDVFTAQMARWWPLDTHSIYPGRSARCVITPREGGEIFEETPDGERGTWGRVTAWEPPARLAFLWWPGGTEETAGDVEVTFTAEGGGTRVTLVHAGWQRLGAAAAEARKGYDEGWGFVFGERFAAACA